MGQPSSIEWTDTTWNPIGGCRRVSPGCENCYAEKIAWRFKGEGQPFEGLVKETSMGPRWSGKVIVRRAQLAWPLRQRPRHCFVASMSDVFHEDLPELASQAIWGVMSVLPRFTFQALTKRPARAREILSRTTRSEAVSAAGKLIESMRDRNLLHSLDAAIPRHSRVWPPRNVWLGTSIEDQKRADKRLPDLIEAPAALRFVSVEPLLGDLSISRFLAPRLELPRELGAPHGVRWVIVGGESGPGARPMHPEWARRVRDECRMIGTAFFFKQWGKYSPALVEAQDAIAVECPSNGRALMVPWSEDMVGRMLDGLVWNERP